MVAAELVLAINWRLSTMASRSKPLNLPGEPPALEPLSSIRSDLMSMPSPVRSAR